MRLFMARFRIHFPGVLHLRHSVSQPKAHLLNHPVASCTINPGGERACGGLPTENLRRCAGDGWARFSARCCAYSFNRGCLHAIHMLSTSLSWPLRYMILFDRDPMFFLHHMFPLIMWPQCIWQGSGSALPMGALVLGESSTPLLGLWWLAKTAGNTRLALSLSRVFTLVFLLFRLGAMPPYVAIFVRAVLAGQLDERFGGPARARVWALLAIMGVGGGFVWSKNLIKGYR